jgi:molybdate/tungstate transport system substrate-binding protein
MGKERMPGQRRLHWLVACSVFLSLAACQRPKELIVFHAASLRHLLADAAAEFHQQNPKIKVRLEPSGSQVAARKVTELGMKADLVALADASLIEKIMIPGHAAWNLEFATNEIVLAHGQHSPFTEEVTAANWPAILLRPGIHLGRANPDTAPLGYHTLFVWQLAEKSGTFKEDGVGLTARLTQLVPKEHVAVDETELLGFLESRAIEYAFIYRSTAEDHRLKFVELPVSLNLSRRDMDEAYKVAEVEVRMKQADQKSILRGHPITYGLTIPNGAPHPEESQRFVEFLIGPSGQAISRATGFKPLVPALSRHFKELPANLRPFAATIP